MLDLETRGGPRRARAARGRRRLPGRGRAARAAGCARPLRRRARAGEPGADPRLALPVRRRRPEGAVRVDRLDRGSGERPDVPHRRRRPRAAAGEPAPDPRARRDRRRGGRGDRPLRAQALGAGPTRRRVGAAGADPGHLVPQHGRALEAAAAAAELGSRAARQAHDARPLPSRDGWVVLGPGFLPSTGPFLTRLARWVCEAGLCDECFTAEDWGSYGIRCLLGQVPPEHYAPFDAALEKLFAARTNVEILRRGGGAQAPRRAHADPGRARRPRALPRARELRRGRARRARASRALSRTVRALRRVAAALHPPAAAARRARRRAPRRARAGAALVPASVEPPAARGGPDPRLLLGARRARRDAHARGLRRDRRARRVHAPGRHDPHDPALVRRRAVARRLGADAGRQRGQAVRHARPRAPVGAAGDRAAREVGRRGHRVVRAGRDRAARARLRLAREAAPRHDPDLELPHGPERRRCATSPASETWPPRSPASSTSRAGPIARPSVPPARTPTSSPRATTRSRSWPRSITASAPARASGSTSRRPSPRSTSSRRRCSTTR